MPTSVVALVILIALAFPGYVFQRRVRFNNPEISRSTFDEVLTILFGGVLIDLLAILLIALFGALTSIRAPHVGEFVETPRQYFAHHAVLVSLWFVAFLMVAATLASAAGSARWQAIVRRFAGDRLERHARRNPNQSAWWLLFNENPHTRVYVGCFLTDGGYVSGYLYSFSTLAVETRDRELTLLGDISYRAAGAKQAMVLPNVNAVSVSADRMQLITVTYVEASAPSPAPDGAGHASAD